MNESPPEETVKDFLEYLGKEEANLLVTFNNLRPEFDIFSKVDDLYRTAIASSRIDSADDQVVLQLLLFAHYQYYHSTSTLLRCHLSDALSSMRTAIEAGLTAYRIIEDRPSQLLYVERDKSFQFPKNFFKKVWKSEPDAYPLAHPLLNRWDACSEYGAHPDISAFVHRLELPDATDRRLKLQYFQHPKNRWEFGWYYLLFVHTFLIILQVFEKDLVQEKSFVPDEWAKSIPQVGKNLEELMEEAKRRGDEAGGDHNTAQPR
jgi:hypothetical protein